MSVKIYNGYLLEGVNTLAGMLESSAGLRASLKSIANNKVRETMIWELAKAHDGGVATIEWSFPFLVNKMQEIKKEKTRNFDWDYEAEWVFLPRGEKDSLLLFYAERPEYTEHIQKNYWWCEYNWWDNQEKPREISEQDWARRKEDWSLTGVFNNPAGQCGANFKLFSDWETPDIPDSKFVTNEFINSIAPPIRRAREIALRNTPLPPHLIEQKSMGAIAEWFSSADFQQDLKNLSEQIAKRLNPLTVDDLLKIKVKETTN